MLSYIYPNFTDKINAEMGSHPIPTKRPRISAEESTVDDQQQQVEMEETSPQKRCLCNELVWELCKEIPTAKTSDQILLTAHKIYAYLAPLFRKKLIIYRDAIAFLKAKLKAKKKIEIRIVGVVAQNDESEPFVVINQKQAEEMFELETNHFTFRFDNRFGFQRREVTCWIYDKNRNYGDAHMHYFLRLMAPLFRPIRLDFFLSDKPIERLMRFLNALSGCIDSIGLSPEQFNSAKFDEALGKYNKLEIFCSRFSSVDMPKLVNWLTNGQAKKCLNIWAIGMADAILFLDEVQRDFARTTSKRRFVVRIIMADASLYEFTLRNELIGEKLQLRHTSVKDGRNICALCRGPNNEFGSTEDDCAEFYPGRMTKIVLN